MSILPGANAAGPLAKKKNFQTVFNEVKRNGMPVHDARKKKRNEKLKHTDTKRHKQPAAVAVASMDDDSVADHVVNVSANKIQVYVHFQMCLCV